METLSEEQRAIVQYDGDHHLLVEAAPGSGKTRTLTERIAHLVTNRKVEPREVLAMTFTRQAADELRARLNARLGARAQGITANTFHAVCGRWLRDYGRAINIAPDFVVLENEARERMLRRAIARAAITVPAARERWVLRDIANTISTRKRKRWSSVDQIDTPGKSTPDQLMFWVRKVELHYREILGERNALDYDDVIVETLHLLENDRDVAGEIQRRYTHLYVDEYHDVSREQFHLLSLLAPPGTPLHRVMVLADQHQSIYGWRYADARRMLWLLHRDYQPKRFALSRNYRSTGHIVRAAESVIRAGGGRVRMSLEHDAGQMVYEKCSDDERAEAGWIVQQIALMHDAGYARYDDIAVLYSQHNRTCILESAFLLGGVPIDRTEDGRFFADTDVQGTLRYLGLVAALHDRSFVSALNWPRVLVDEPTMLRIQGIAQSNGLSLAQLARTIDTWRDGHRTLDAPPCARSSKRWNANLSPSPTSPSRWLRNGCSNS